MAFLIDPYSGQMLPQQPIGLGPAPAPAPAPPPLPTYSPEDEQSLLLKIGHKALAGLGFLGQSLDKAFGGRAIRGVLGGNPREALSILPFSDTLGITDPEQIVYGRQLLEKAGVLDPGTPGFDAGDVAGFAADVLLDPASYISPFALTKAGGALSKRGALKGSWGEQARGAQYLESQVGKLEPARIGLAAPKELVEPGSVLVPKDVQREVEKEIGDKLVPQYRRVATRAAEEPLPPLQLAPGQPNVAVPLAPGMANPLKTYEDALGAVGEGRIPAPGRYVGDVNYEGYKALDVSPPPAVADDALRATARELIDKPTGAATPLRGLLGIGLPFAEPSVVLGTGETGAKILDKLGVAGDWLKSTRPVRYARALLDNPVDRTLTAPGQDIASTLKRPLEQDMTSNLMAGLFEMKKGLEPVYTKAADEEVNRLLYRAVEGVPNPAGYKEYAQDLLARDPARYARLEASGDLELMQRQFGKIQAVADQMGQANRGFLEGERGLAIPGNELQDGDYLMRILNPLPPEGRLLSRMFNRARQAVGGTHTSQLARKEIFENFPEGTTQINELLRQLDPVTGKPRIVGPQRVLSQQLAEEEIRKQLTRTPLDPASGFGAANHFVNEAEQQIAAQNLFRSEAEAQAFIQANNVTNPLQQDTLLRAGRQGEQLLGEAAKKQAAINEQAAALAEHAQSLDPRLATLTGENGERGINFFREDPLLSVAVRGQKSVKAQSGVQALYEGLHRIAKPAGEFEPGTSVAVPRLLEAAGLNVKHGPGVQVSAGAEELAAKALGIKPEQLANYHVPADVGQDLTKWLKSWTQPEEIAPVAAAFDAATNMMKAWLTIPFPAFHARNVMSGVFNMWRDNALSLGAMAEARDLLNGRPIQALPGMKGGPEQILNETLKEIYANRVAFVGGARSGGDLLRTKAGQLMEDIANVPGRFVKPPPDMAQALVENSVEAGKGGGVPVARFLAEHGLNTPEMVELLKARGLERLNDFRIPPEAMADVLGTTSLEHLASGAKSLGQNLDFYPSHLAGVSSGGETNTLARAGRMVSNTAEDWMRISHYLAKRRQGFAPAEAAEAVRKYHFDYADVTPFERGVMKRFIPFYTFSSKNLPPILEDLATRPAKLSASIRGATLGSEETQMFTPPYLGEGANVPIPGAPEGAARFISSFGMPFEDEFVKALGSVGALDFKRATGEVLGGMNPFLKYPIEEATGRQLYSGRELRDLRPNFAGDVLGLGNEDASHFLTQLLANTPASRTISTVEKLLDDRKDALPKALNLLTGFKVTDVDLQKQQEIAARGTLQEILKGSQAFRTFEDVYVKPEKLPELAPDELAVYALYKQIQKENEAKARAKKRDTQPAR